MEQDVKVESESVLYAPGSIWSHLSENSSIILQNLLFCPEVDLRKVVKGVKEFRCPLQIRKTPLFLDTQIQIWIRVEQILCGDIL